MHGTRKSQCRGCGGSEICVHGKIKFRCKECGGGAFCVHGKIKFRCKECGGSAFCVHGKLKSQCKDCGGSEICEHNKKRSYCKDCGGTQICEHGKRKSRCKECGGRECCPNCITWPDSRQGISAYDGYCATCFKHLFPTDARSKVVYTHTKEMRVRNTINEEFEGFIHDKPIWTGGCDCTHRRRIDHRKLIGATLLCIETDENAHAEYDPKDEEVRYDDLSMVHGGKMVFIRFNPDGKGVDMVDKLERLVDEIRTQIARIEEDKNTELLEVIKLFYPSSASASSASASASSASVLLLQGPV